MIRLLLVALSALPASAQQPEDRGTRMLPKLFQSAASSATQATVRIQCDGEDAALGTVVTSDGHILTKGSEVRGVIVCVFANGTKHSATIVGYHKATDLALLKIAASGLARVSFAPDSAVVVGRWTATTTTAEEPLAVGILGAPIRKLVGDQAVIENQNKGYLGVLGLRDAEDTVGVVIGEVIPSSAAAKAGMRAGDVIFEVNGKAVKDRDTLLSTMEHYRAGAEVTLRVRRGADELTLKAKLTYKNEADRAAFQNGMGGALSGRRTGFPAIVQHDTVLRPADCGGPIVDLDGRVLGVNIARAGRAETWALPASVIEPVLKDLIAGKYAPPK